MKRKIVTQQHACSVLLSASNSVSGRLLSAPIAPIPMKLHVGRWGWSAVAALWLLAAVTHAQLDCTHPDDSTLCHGHEGELIGMNDGESSNGVLGNKQLMTGILSTGTGFAVHPAGIETRIHLAFDGTYYWAVSAGSTSGNRLAKFDAAGNPLGVFAAGLDFRSVYVVGGTLYAREYASSTIYRMVSDGVFTVDATLSASIDDQSRVVPNPAQTRLYGLEGPNTVKVFDMWGNLLSSVSLLGFPGTTSYPMDFLFCGVKTDRILFGGSDNTIKEYDLVSGALLSTTSIALDFTSSAAQFSCSLIGNNLWFDLNNRWTQFGGTCSACQNVLRSAYGLA